MRLSEMGETIPVFWVQNMSMNQALVSISEMVSNSRCIVDLGEDVYLPCPFPTKTSSMNEISHGESKLKKIICQTSMEDEFEKTTEESWRNAGTVFMLRRDGE